MSRARIIRSIFVAAGLASVCVLGGLNVAAGSLVVATLCLYFLPQGADEPSGFGSWAVCSISFAAVALAWMPWTLLHAVNVGLAVFSPVFGWAGYTFERLIATRMMGRGRDVDVDFK